MKIKPEVWEELKAELDSMPGPVPGFRHYIGYDLSIHWERAALCLLTVNTKKHYQEARWIVYCQLGYEICLDRIGEEMGESHPLSSENAGGKGFVCLFKEPADLSRMVVDDVITWRQNLNNPTIIVDDSIHMRSICSKLGQEHAAMTVQAKNTPLRLKRALQTLDLWMGNKKIKIEDNPIVFQHFQNTEFKNTSRGDIPCQSNQKVDYKNQAFLALAKAVAGEIECRSKKTGTKLNPIDNEPAEGQEPLKAEDLIIPWPNKRRR